MSEKQILPMKNNPKQSSMSNIFQFTFCEFLLTQNQYNLQIIVSETIDGHEEKE